MKITRINLHKINLPLAAGVPIYQLLGGAARRELGVSEYFALRLPGSVAERPAGKVGRRYPPEWRTYDDPTTGRQVTQLTNSDAEDYHLYFYNPSVGADGQFLDQPRAGQSPRPQPD